VIPIEIMFCHQRPFVYDCQNQYAEAQKKPFISNMPFSSVGYKAMIAQHGLASERNSYFLSLQKSLH